MNSVEFRTGAALALFSLRQHMLSITGSYLAVISCSIFTLSHDATVFTVLSAS